MFIHLQMQNGRDLGQTLNILNSLKHAENFDIRTLENYYRLVRSELKAIDVEHFTCKGEKLIDEIFFEIAIHHHFLQYAIQISIFQWESREKNSNLIKRVKNIIQRMIIAKNVQILKDINFGNFIWHALDFLFCHLTEEYLSGRKFNLLKANELCEVYESLVLANRNPDYHKKVPKMIFVI